MRGILWCAALLCAASGAVSGAVSGAESGAVSGAESGAASGEASGAGPQCARDQPCTALRSSRDGDYYFKIRGNTLSIEYSEERHFSVRCGDVTLDDPALPALPRRAPVARVRLAGCAPPRHGYAHALAALNVSLANATLELRAVGAALDAAALARLPELDRLFVYDDELQELDLSATPLRDVTVSAPLRALTLGARVEALSLQHAVSAELRGACTALRRVTLSNFTRPLPARWLARCGGVRELRVDNSRGALGDAELEGASAALRVLEATSCGLRELPPRWLADAGQLRKLDLYNNELTRLPSLAASPLLEELWAQSNRLDAAALAPLGELGALGALRVLGLDNNPLGDLCGNNDTNVVNAVSPLAGLSGLRELGLQGTGLTALCRDWRLQMPHLDYLVLSDNDITGLTPAELQWRRAVPAVVDLRGNDVRVLYTRDDYRAALQLRPDPQAPLTTLLLDNVPQCGCDDYWFARAWRERPGHARVALRGLRCRGEDGTERELLDVPLDALLCDKPENDTSLAPQDIVFV